MISKFKTIMRNILIVALLSFLPQVVFADQNITTEVKSVTGYGVSKPMAISDALVRAVGQLKGVSLSSDQIINRISSDSSQQTNGDWQQSFEATGSIQQYLRAKTKGQLASYTITLIDKTQDGYEAILSVTYHRYEEVGHSADNRRKLAVVPFISSKNTFNLLGDITPARKVESELRGNLIDLFTQSRRLSVLDREFGEAFENEKALWLSDDAAKGETARLGNVKGTDYLLIGKILNVKSIRHVETIQLTGERIESYRGNAQVSYKIIQAPTRQVKWSDTVTMKFDDDDIRRMLQKFGSSQSGILYAVAEDIVQDALANIYPMRVVAVKGKTVVINQGGKSLKKGDVFDVFFVGDEMFDPYTKESLGYLEEKIGRIKVVKAMDKVTYTKLIEGEIELVEQGAIIRKPSSE